MKKILAFTLISIFIVAGVLFGVRYYNQYRNHLEQQTRFTMDTFVTVYAIGPERIAKPAINKALDKIQEVNNKFDSLSPRSQVYKFNHANRPIDDPEIIELVKVAMGIAEITEGAFDITVAPLIELWGFHGDKQKVPDDEAIRNRLEKVGYRHLAIGPEGLVKNSEDVRIDLGAIAKGYAIGRAAAVLKNEGIENALIDAGGDIYAMGKRGSRLWKVGIRSPRKDELLGYVEVENKAVMGSGDYERFFMENGERYHHIFDPKTGRPARGISGITLIYPDAMLADAWNTALFVMGPEKAMDFVEKTPGMEVVLVDGSNDVRFSSGLKNMLNMIENEKK